MPDMFASAVLSRVLDIQPDMDIVPGSPVDCEVVLVHCSLTGSHLALLAAIADAGKMAIVTAAPSEPDDLARYLEAGARGYHRSGESLAQLLDVIREVYAGDVRYDPFVMACLLRDYRALRGDAGQSISTFA
jgi:DNA-binding NarL/FixJ family response regulator